MKNVKNAFIIAAGFTLSAAAFADTRGVNVSAKISTLGLGLEVGAPVTEHFSARIVGNSFSYSTDYTDDEDNEYDGKLKLGGFGAVADYHPFKGSFRVSAGAMSNRFALSAKTAGDNNDFQFETDDFEYNGQGSAAINIEARKFAPYLGLGWATAPKSTNRLRFSFDVGALLQGSPRANINISGDGTVTDKETGETRPANFTNDPGVQQDIEAYENSLNDEAKDFKIYPVISFGVGWAFKL